MKFTTPRNDHAFEIDDAWWAFAEMEQFNPSYGGGYYPCDTRLASDTHVLRISEIEPPKREAPLAPFKKYKLVPVLLAFQSPECALPPVSVVENPLGSRYRYRLMNGFHRYYASVAVGYASIPALVQEPYAP